MCNINKNSYSPRRSTVWSIICWRGFRRVFIHHYEIWFLFCKIWFRFLEALKPPTWKKICSTKGKYWDRSNRRSEMKTMVIIYLYDRKKFRIEKKKHYIIEDLYCLTSNSCRSKFRFTHNGLIESYMEGWLYFEQEVYLLTVYWYCYPCNILYSDNESYHLESNNSEYVFIFKELVILKKKCPRKPHSA